MASPSITPVTTRLAQTVISAIQQRVASGFHFDGTLPQTAGVRADSPLRSNNSRYTYAPLAASGGGLFFWNNFEPLICSQVYVDLGAVGDVTVSLVNLDPAHVSDDLPTVLADETFIVYQATGVRFIALDETKFKVALLPYQAIKIVTTNTGAAQIALVLASLEKSFVR